MGLTPPASGWLWMPLLVHKSSKREFYRRASQGEVIVQTPWWRACKTRSPPSEFSGAAVEVSAAKNLKLSSGPAVEEKTGRRAPMPISNLLRCESAGPDPGA